MRALISNIWRRAGGRRLLVVVALAGLLMYWSWLPSRLFPDAESTVLLDRQNELLAARIAPDGQWRFPAGDSVPYKFRNCILLFEDEYFYYHPGVNPASLFRSFRDNLRASGIKSGGSTVTMQLARMMRHNQPRTYYQKVIEMLLALRIELSYKKSSILNLYCSHAPFGSNVVGLNAASWRYFGRGPEKLSWAESAVLAVLPNAPSLIYPGKNQGRLLEKRNRLLKKLYTKQIIDEPTYRLALQEPLPQKPYPIPQTAAHLLGDCVKRFGASGQFRSTLDKALQERVDELLNRHVLRLSANQIHNACALVVETETGKVLAYVGNSSSPANAHENFVDVIQAPRSTGSILKPFLYAFMLNENKILPASLLEDVPTRVGAYGPKNFSLSYDGLVPADQAIARSLNVPAVKMLQDYGVARFHQRLKQLGFTTFKAPASYYGLSLILGGGEASLWEIAGAYSSMARALLRYSGTRNRYAEGSYHPLYYLERTSPEKVRGRQVSDLLGASSIYFTFRAMTELLRPQDYKGWASFLSQAKISWKTGTSFGFRDAWAVGLNGRYTVAVWVGNADGEGRPELTGTSAAAPLLFSIFNTLGREAHWFAKPAGDLEKIRVCRQSGFKASAICDPVDEREYPAGSERTGACPFHRLIHLDKSGTSRVSSDCYPVAEMQHRAWFVASPAQAYFYKQHALDYVPLPAYLPGCEPEQGHRQFEILYPKEGFRVYVPVDQSGERGRCVFKATHHQAGATLFWYLDGEYIGFTQNYHQLSLLPESGEHILELLDEAGESQRCSFTVLKK